MMLPDYTNKSKKIFQHDNGKFPLNVKLYILSKTRKHSSLS